MAGDPNRTLTGAEKALIEELGLRISPSSKKNFGDCNRMWWLKKVAKVPEPNKPHLLLGKAVHSLFEVYVPTGKYPSDRPELVLADDDSEDWSIFPGGFDALVVSASRIATDGVHLAMDLREQAHKVPGSVRVEEKVEGTCGALPYIGYIDILREPWDHPRGFDLPAIEDYKTSSNPDRYGPQTPVEIAHDPQMAFYAKTYWVDVRGHQGDVVLAHHKLPTKGRGSYRTVRGVATQEILQRNWEDFEATTWAMLDTAKETDVKKVAPNRGACHMYGGCPYRGICPADSSYQPTDTPTNKTPEASMTIAEQLAALKAKAAGAAPPPEPTVKPLTEEQKAALTQALFDLHNNNALSYPAVDALLVQHAADPDTAAEVREAAKALIDSDDTTGRVNPPDSRPTPTTPEATKAAQDQDFAAVVKVFVSLVQAGKEVDAATYDLITQGKGLDDRKAEVLEAVVAACPDTPRDSMGALFRPTLADDATPTQKFRDIWERAGRGDVDLSRSQFRDWVKDATGAGRYSFKAAGEIMAELVDAGLFVATKEPNVFHDVDAAHPEPEPEEPKADEQPQPEEPKPDGQPEPAPTNPQPQAEAPTNEGVKLFMVGCVSPYAMSLDDYLVSVQAETHFAEVAKRLDGLDATRPYWLQPFNQGPKTMANILCGLYDDGKLPVPGALWCSAGHPLADALSHELGRRGVYVIRGLR